LSDNGFGFDSSGNQSSSSILARQWATNSLPNRYEPVLQGSSWTRSYYGADEKLRVFQRTGFDPSGMRTTFVEYHYDALGRRVMTRTRQDTSCVALPVPTCLSTLDRFVWDGSQLLAESRSSVAPLITDAGAEAEFSNGTLSGNHTTSNYIGRIQYTHA